MTQRSSPPPFMQLGRRVRFTYLCGHALEEVAGEVMDTETDWLAVQADGIDAVTWYNLRYVVTLHILDRPEKIP